MKIKILSVLAAAAVLLAGCKGEDLPGANFSLDLPESITATAGDSQATVEWTKAEGTSPTGYLLTWISATAGVAGGEEEFASDVFTATVTGLTNDSRYTFSVQARYGEGLSGKIDAVCTPVNLRFPVTGLSAAAGDGRVKLQWTPPASSSYTGYSIVVTPGDRQIPLTDVSLASYIVGELTNGTEYTFTVTAVYPQGSSPAATATSTPGEAQPILVSPGTRLVKYQTAIFSYNDMAFMDGDIASVSWDFGDGSAVSTDFQPRHFYTATGDCTVTLTVTYEGGGTGTGNLTVTVVDAWSSLPVSHQGLTGYVKTSNAVFSPDGTTLYIPTSTPAGHLFAVDVALGTVKWVYEISGVTYGGGPLVAPDGTVYQCGEADMTVHAIKPDGSSLWKNNLGGKMGAFPALSADGTLYCATNGSGNKLYAIKAADGTELWSASLDGGTASAILIDNTGNVYAGSYGGIFAFESDGTPKWTKPDYAVTERGAFAVKGTTLYATLRATGGLVALDMADGSEEWRFAVANGDSYFPVVDGDGVIYFSQKGTLTVYAVNPDGTQKWKTTMATNQSLNYSGLALGDNGILYGGTNGSSRIVFGLQASDGTQTFTDNTDNQQAMAAASLGPDKRLYVGTIGSGNIGSMRAYDVDTGLNTAEGAWPVRGGDMQGTNRQK
jgi:outer membrane protein assembly factor BamB